MKSKLYTLMFVFLSFFMLAGCDSKNNNSKTESSIKSNHHFMDVEKIEVVVDDTYRLDVMLTDLVTTGVKYSVSNKSIAKIENDHTLVAKKVGNTQVVIKAGSKVQAVPLKVYAKDDYEHISEFKMDKGRLYEKNVVFYGDSITQYQVWEGEYVLSLKNYYKLNHTNFAMSGTTLVYTQNRYDEDTTGVAFMTQNEQANKNADFIFILYGTNDIDEAVPVGEKDSEILSAYNDHNPTYIGGINFAIKTLRNQNPNAKIIFLGLVFRAGPVVKTYDSALQRQCWYNLVKYIHLHDLWDDTNASTYMKDGLHPNSAGYQKMYERIIAS